MSDVQAFIDASLAGWNDGDYSGLEELASPGFTRIAPPSFGSDAGSLEELEALITDFRTQFPDVHITVQEVIEAGDRFTVFWTAEGTNTGPGDFPPTGRSFEVHGVSVNRIENGKMAGETAFFDTAQFMSQLGLVELPG